MVLQGFISIVSLSPLLSNLHRRILRSAIIACALQKKNLRTHIRMKKKQRNTKKFATIVILQVSIEGVLIACVI